MADVLLDYPLIQCILKNIRNSIVRNPDNYISFKLWKHMEGKPFTMDTA